MTNLTFKGKNLCWRSGFFLIVLSFTGISAQSRYSEEAQAEFFVRRDKIQAELSELQTHEWAGEYGAYDQMLFLAPNSGFAYFMSGGDDSRNWEKFLMNYGTVRYSDGKIRLTPALPNKEETVPRFSTELLFILWDERHYLVPADEIVEFINYVNIGFEPSSAIGGFGNFFFLRKGDIAKKVSGKPNIPEQYRSYLLENPIKGKIKTVLNSQIEKDGDRPQRKTKVVLNVGKNKGVFEGMEFLIYDPRRIPDTVKITKVGDDYSEGFIIQTYLEYKVPAVGWKVSTSLKDIK